MNRAENSVGHMPCSCGQVKDVRQSKKRGRYLYTNCGQCGLDQRTGAPVQNEIYHQATFDRDVIKPANVTEDWQPKVSEPQPKPVSEQASEPATELERSSVDLTAEELAVDEPETRATTGGRPKNNILTLLGWLMLAACGMGALWTSIE